MVNLLLYIKHYRLPTGSLLQKILTKSRTLTVPEHIVIQKQANQDKKNRVCKYVKIY